MKPSRGIPTQAGAALSRARRLLSDHHTLAKKAGAVLDYTLADVRQLLDAHPLCEYCRRPLGWDASIDHGQPIARGGKHALDNLTVCCPRCNGLKGMLTGAEFAALMACLDKLHPTARQDVERRLLAGGKRYGRR